MTACAKTPAVPNSPRSIERIVLGNGTRVWTEHVPRSSSVAIGVWIDWMSPHEERSHSGAAHLVQRVAFHGTSERTGEQIARAVESVGGRVSITTGRDHCGYLAQAAPNKLQAAFGLVADLALRPIATQLAIAVEQKKVMDEVLAEAADPNVCLEALFLRSAWIGLGYCREPKGRLLRIRESTSLQSFTPSVLRRLHRESHRPSAITVTLSGNLDHEKVQQAADRIFGAIEEPAKVRTNVTAASRQFWATCNRPEFGVVRMMIGVPACGAADPERHVAALLAAVLGGGRLTRLLEANRCSAEACASQLILFAHEGVLAARLSTEPSSAHATLASAVETMRRLTTDWVSAGELKSAREKYSCALHPKFDSMVERIHDMARQERYFSAVVDPNQEQARMQAVTPREIRDFASSRIARHTLSLAALGNLGGADIHPAALQW